MHTTNLRMFPLLLIFDVPVRQALQNRVVEYVVLGEKKRLFHPTQHHTVIEKNLH